MLTAKRIDATSGPLVRQILLYSIPLILSSILQNLFTAVDTAVLGKMADSIAVASVGATGTVTALLVNIFLNFSAGVRILLSRAIGERNQASIQRIVDSAVTVALSLGLLSMVVGWLFAPFILQLVNCPAECYDGALLYLRIYVSAAPAILLYNFCSSMISTAGNTQSPLYYMIAGGVLNVVLNIILCLILPNKVAAVALATVASNVLGAVLSLCHLCRGEGPVQLQFSRIRFHGRVFGRILSIGFPICLTNALYPISNLQIQANINSFGPSATAGSHAEILIESIIASVHGNIAVTSNVFMGQNLGAQKPDRVKRTFFTGLVLCTGLAELLGLLCTLTSRFWLSLFLTDDPAALEYGMIKILYLLAFYGIMGFNSVLVALIQSFGYSSISSINSVFSILIFRIIWMAWIYPINPTFATLMQCFPVSWVLAAFINGIVTFVLYQRYRKGKYRRFS